MENCAAWNRRLKDDGWRSARDAVHCVHCGEERMVLATTINGVTRLFCDVCAKTTVIREQA